MVFDPLRHAWEVLLFIPNFPVEIPLFHKCVCVNRKLLLIDRHNIKNWKILKRVYNFDFVFAKWHRGENMPMVMHNFGCSVSSSTELIYITGGRDDQFNVFLSAEAYNVEQDKWKIMPPMGQPLDDSHGFFMEEKFIVFNEKENNAIFFNQI